MAEKIQLKSKQRAEQMHKLEDDIRNDPKHDPGELSAITDMGSLELSKRLKTGELTAVQVLRAFQWKALEVTKRINCITEFIPEAQSWAEACDATSTERRGLLHGIPFSVKDNVNIQGMDSTMGLEKFLFQPASRHAILVQVLLENGAVPFCKTNVPQLLLSFCCTNPVFGTTVNPHDHSRTPGGSSGGEAALIGGGGSPFGIGTDLGGSVRVPASYSGCFSMKPSQNRLSGEGVRQALPGLVGVASCPGIFGRDTEIIKICMKALTGTQYMYLLDSVTVPIPWNEQLLAETRTLTFGYFDNLDFFPCTPGVRRAVREAKDALEKAGHTLVPFLPPEEPEKTLVEILRIALADSGKTMKKCIKNEILDPSLEALFLSSTAPRWKKSFMTVLVGRKSKLMAKCFQDKYNSTYQFWLGLSKREVYIQQFSKQWKEKKLDLLLSPATLLPAPQQFTQGKFGVVSSYYTSLFNYLDFPSGVVPVTKETQEDQILLKKYSENELHLQLVKEATKEAVGLPIGVLISGLRWQEELVCRGMSELERAIQDCS